MDVTDEMSDRKQRFLCVSVEEANRIAHQIRIKAIEETDRLNATLQKHLIEEKNALILQLCRHEDQAIRQANQYAYQQWALEQVHQWQLQAMFMSMSQQHAIEIIQAWHKAELHAIPGRLALAYLHLALRD